MPNRKPAVRSSPDRSFARTSPSILSASSHSGLLQSMRSLPASYGMATLHARFVHDSWDGDKRGSQYRSAVGIIHWMVLTSTGSRGWAKSQWHMHLDAEVRITDSPGGRGEDPDTV